MSAWFLRLFPCAAVAVLLLVSGPAAAARVRFHFVPVDACGNTTLQPGLGPGERVSWFGTVREPYADQPRPTHLVTFRHPATGSTITLPLYFPEGTPRIEHVGDRIVYNYGSYTVEVRFLPDGSADVIYNSGLFRGV
jgi:hypothetical protein